MIPNCCLVISLVYEDRNYNLNIFPVYKESDELINYSFSITGFISLIMTYEDGTWYIIGQDTEDVYYTLESTSCPTGNMSQWTSIHENKPPFSNFTIYDTGCGGPKDGVVVEIEINNTVYNPCKYKNALIKGKRGLSQDVANLKGAEVFQLDSCKSDWSSAIAKYLAIDALKCPPYNMYTESDERCLISQLATNYKC